MCCSQHIVIDVQSIDRTVAIRGQYACVQVQWPFDLRHFSSQEKPCLCRRSIGSGSGTCRGSGATDVGHRGVFGGQGKCGVAVTFATTAGRVNISATA